MPTTSHKRGGTYLKAIGVGLVGALAKHGVQSTPIRPPDLYSLRLGTNLLLTLWQFQGVGKKGTHGVTLRR